MSLVKSKAIQLGFDATPTNNFLIYQPLTPDGTFRIANGNQGATTDIMTVTSGGSVTFAGTTNFSSLNFGAGSESAPSLFPTGDSNTGIWFPAADTFALSTGGAERLRVASSGNVGIGTNNPVTKLDVVGSVRSRTTTGEAQLMVATDSRQVYLYNSYAGNTYGLFDGTAAQHRMYYDSASNFWAFHTGASERLRIDSTGNTFMYGQGAASKGTLTLQSADSFLRLKTTGGTTDKQQWDLRAISATGSEAFEIRTINDANTVFSTKLWIANGGNIGVGTTSPNTKLEVYGQRIRVNDATDPGIELANTTAVKGYLFYDTSGPDVVTLRHSSSGSGVHVNSSGNTGIGTNAPSEKLDVNGTARAKAFRGSHAKTYHFSTLFNTPGNGNRRFHIGRLFDNNQYNWGHFGCVKIRIYDSYYSSGGFREYTLTPYNNIIGGNSVSIVQSGGLASGSSYNYKVSLGPSVATGLTYGGQPINYYNIYIDTQYYVLCTVEVEVHSNNTASTVFDVTTPTTTGYGSGNYWMSEFYTDTYVAANYTDSAVTGSFKWAESRTVILKQVPMTSYTDYWDIDLRPYYDHWKTVEIYLHYYTTTPTRADHFLNVKDPGYNSISMEWNCWSMKRNAGGTGGFTWVDSNTAASVWGRYATTVDSGNLCFFKFTIDLTNPSDITAGRVGILWDGNYTWGDIGASKATGSAHPVGTSRIAYMHFNQDAGVGYSGTPAGYYMYTIVGIN